jgi:hypothetical protein
MNITLKNVTDKLDGQAFYFDKILWFVTDVVQINDIGNDTFECYVLVEQVNKNMIFTDIHITVKVTKNNHYDDMINFTMLKHSDYIISKMEKKNYGNNKK